MISLLERNKDFIAQETIMFLKDKFPEYEFDKELCRRDANIITDIVAGELRVEGGHYPADDAPKGLCEDFWQLQRYKKSFLVFREQNEATIETIKFCGDLIKGILQNHDMQINRGLQFFQIKDIEIEATEENIEKVDEVLSLIVANAGAGKVKNNFVNFIEDYFEKGYIITETPPTIQEKLWDEVRNTKWVKGKFNNYKQVPKWYQEQKRMYIDPTGIDRPMLERQTGNWLFDKAPQSLVDIGNELIKDKMFDPLRMYRPDQVHLKYIHFWNGSENSPHHCDGIDGSDLMIFCYLTDAGEWKEEWGGYINMLKEVDSKFYYTRTVMPDDGRMVLINNSAPIFKHGIRDLVNKDVNRYTFIFHYTWTY